MKSMMLVYPRSGSHFLMRILTGNPDIIDKGLLSKPEAKACTESCTMSVLPVDHKDNPGNWIFFDYAFETRPDLKVPEQGALYSLDSIAELPTDWKFVYLVRDGRDQIESYWHLIHMGAKRRGQLHSRMKDEDIEYASNIFKQRAQRIIDCSANLDNYVFFKFEDLVASPVSTSTSIIQALGFTPREDLISKYVSLIQPNTSYKSVSKVTNRSKIWSKKHRDIFWSIAGKQANELGYSK